MVYVVERYLPGLTRSNLLGTLADLERATEELGEGPAVRYLGSTIVIGDEACFCQFEAASEAAVAEANRRAGLSFDRIVPAVTVRPTERGALMNVETTTVSMPVRLRRSRPYVIATAALAAVATAAVLLIGSGTSTTDNTSAPNAGGPSYTQQQGKARVTGLAALTPEQIAAAFGSGTVGGEGRSSGERRVKELSSLTPEEISAAFGTGR